VSGLGGGLVAALLGPKNRKQTQSHQRKTAKGRSDTEGRVCMCFWGVFQAVVNMARVLGACAGGVAVCLCVVGPLEGTWR
jgi:hypothetical protein